MVRAAHRCLTDSPTAREGSYVAAFTGPGVIRVVPQTTSKGVLL